jgi:2-C-methyl-D-erythritol 4-phosphate cytidylyltransferase
VAVWAVLVAAGRGERLGDERPKAFARLGGRVLAAESLERLDGSAWIDAIVVVAPPEWEEAVIVLAEELALGKVVSCVTGGETRAESVRAGLAEVADDADVILVHDAARPLVTPEIIRATLAGLDPEADAAIAAARVTDTIKEGDGTTVGRTLDRSRLWAIQTPQVFRREVLERALAQPHDVLAAATDDASIVEGMGGTVRLVESPRDNLKVTTADDLRLAELLLAQRARATT